MDDEINDNELYNKEMSSKNINLKTKIFDIFYILINKKNKTNKITLCILYIIEIIQVISYAFFHPHLEIWNLPSKNMEIISIVTSIFRITPILNYTTFNVYLIILIILVFFIFFFGLSIIMQILFRKENSRIYNGLLSVIDILIPLLTIFLFIPINELLLLILRCKDDKIEFSEEYYQIKCWRGTHLLYSILGIIACLLNFSFIIFLNFFYFNPFQTETSTIKLNSKKEIIFLIIKFIFIARLCFIKNQNISIAILLVLSFFLLFKDSEEPIYNCHILEKIINIRNFLMLWTFIMLFVAKLCENTEINNLIYLVFLGYPIIIYSSIMLTKEKEKEFTYKNYSLNNINSCLYKTRFLIMLINFFIDKNVNLKNIESGNKNDLILKGIINIHTEKCLDEECPLTKFIKNEGNFNVQKQCLLNYMTLYFNKAMKMFPYNKLLRLYFIHFNFSNKFNLNSVRANLEHIKKMKNDIIEEFIIYCIENEIIKMKNKALNVNDGNESEEDSLIIEQNYKRLKDLITKSTKLYVEFWGIFSTNITNNLNTYKLYALGEKLNTYLNEINSLWGNYLVNKKLDSENEYIVQLYSKFLREILWDKSKSEEVQKKINEEYHNQGFKHSTKDNEKSDSIDNIIENQDYMIFANSNEKGKCTIFQFSNSLTYLVGYQKQEMINKPIEVLMPPIFIDGHAKKVEEFIKATHTHKNFDKESLHGAEKNKTFLLIKSKMGYLIPFYAKFTIFDDNDFSNNFIIKTNLELGDAKSMYAYYILAKPDFTVDNISSSAIHLGLTMDLLKKYVIKLNTLIRTSKDLSFNLLEKYNTYIEKPRRITWVYPDIIYPKNDKLKNKVTQTKELIKISKKKKFNLQIREMKYKEGEIIGFVFKLSEISNKKGKNEFSYQELIPSNKNEVMFDLLNLKYIRTIMVQQKSGLHNLRENEEECESKEGQKSKSIERKVRNARNKVDEESSDEDEHPEMILTKDRILELHGRDSNGIKSFINILPFYGEEIALIKHRPNKEQYQAGNAHEPSIRISINTFVKRMDIKLKKNPSLLKKIKNTQNQDKENEEKDDIEAKKDFISSLVKQNEIDNKEKDEINKDLIGDSSITLSNIFNENSINNIKIVDFIIYIVIISISVAVFCFTYKFINNSKTKFLFLDNSYKILNNIAYIKYFVDEAVLINTLPNYIISEKIGEEKYINYLKDELLNYRQEFTDLYSSFTNVQSKFSKNLKNYLSNKNITIKTLSNGKSIDEEQPFNLGMNKLSTSIFYISSISDFKLINMNNTYTYELMFNLLNGYYSTCMNIYLLLLEDIKQSKKNPEIFSKTLIFISLLLAILCIFSFYKFMVRLVLDREKSINLFFTIKKNLFEDLKNSAENFSNKLLNKFFGNEENEEESQQVYGNNIKPNDINIAKFKALNEYKKSINKGGSFMFYLGILLTFFIIYEISIILIYFYYKSYFSNLFKFSEVYNVTQISHTYILLRTNFIKQYLFNETLSNYNMGNIISFSLYSLFHDMSGPFSNTIKITTKTDSFLKDEYKELFRQYLYNDFSKFVEIENIKNHYNYNYTINNGIKHIESNLFEKFRYLCIKYFINPQRNEDKISELLNDKKWFDIHQIIINFIRPWYKNIIEVMNSCFFSLVESILITFISIFILIIILVTLAYCIIWKSYEEKFFVSLKNSFDLINLIPKEIKCIIVSKLNE